MLNYRIPRFEVLAQEQSVYEKPAGVRMIQAEEVWPQSRKGEDVVVAVIDSGCDVNHTDLKSNIIDTRNFVTTEGGAQDVTDRNGHGTHVAGTIAAVENGAGVVGVAPKVKLLIVKVMQEYKDANGDVSYGASNSCIIDAIRYCMEWRGGADGKQRVRVINMSLGGEFNDPKLHKAVQEAVANDILVVCAAGNEGRGSGAANDEIMYPGAYPEAVCVGAISLDGTFPPFTNTNDQVDLVAPGDDIWSTYTKPSYAKLKGTSMAAPHVAGAAALLINWLESKYNRTFTEPEIYAQLIKRTVSLGEDPRLEGCGLLQLNHVITVTADSVRVRNHPILA
ncbi:S8 family peptidase [Paenibacillus sp. YYML68]|uniref:S8 family peptidase n=1 Tax=Paenibacillus sp. YYML68 TaxID=2909250 RepID=UPI0024914782|nr:S8 family peptidase [Paenibacillus sp. YYML68]